MKIAKLHDPPYQGGGANLSIRYIIEHFLWPDCALGKLREVEGRLCSLPIQFKEARNKRIAHNDREVILNDESVGAFGKDEDAHYFENLQVFVDIIFEERTGKAKPFDDRIEYEAEAFRQVLLRGWYEEKEEQKT
ncbi:MAG: hypothetical protein Q7U56_12535 [Humidesulfovibrio sp.]|nr:hypothetical protein [Humidesulfovibrio sp.]